jgi:methionyl-tRNA synthetase
MTKSFYITTPIYYVNDSPHIGHAYTNIVTDILARYHRISGKNVKFLTGTDEHGQKVEKSAIAKNIPAQDFVDQVSQTFRTLCTDLNISNDDFIRTTDQRHKDAVIAIWQKLQENGHIYKDKYSGWYSVRDEAFYSESEITEDKKAPTGAPVEWVEEESYFFNLSKWQDKLLQFYEENPEVIYPKSRKNEVISFIKSGLKDLSISRVSLNWGIGVPNEQKHTIYVWLDALTNYLSAIHYPDENNDDFKNYWPEAHHIIGKDILRFHAVYWPAFLMAANLTLPKKIIAHGWWVRDGQKISKSIGNIIVPADLINEFGLDQFRYFLSREITFGNDGNYSRANLVNRVNSELSNKIGNLLQRSLSMVYKNCAEEIPQNITDDIYEDNKLLADALSCFEKYSKAIETPEFSSAIGYVIELAEQANIYIDENAPWALKNTNPEKMQQILYVILETCRYIGILLQPIIPESATKILHALSVPQDQRLFMHLNAKFRLKSGTKIPLPQAIFPRFEGE